MHVLQGPYGDDLGFSLNPVKAVKNVGKGIAKGVSAGAKGVAKGVSVGAKGVTKGAVAAGKAAVQVVTLPLHLVEKILLEAAIPIGRALCAAPDVLLQSAGAAAGVSPSTVRVFCTALSVRRMSDVKRYLPAILRLAVQLGASGAFPPIAPALAAARAIPGAKYVPLLKILVAPAVRQAVTRVAPPRRYYEPAPAPQTYYAPPAEAPEIEAGSYVPPDYYTSSGGMSGAFDTPGDLSTGAKIAAGALILSTLGLAGAALYSALDSE